MSSDPLMVPFLQSQNRKAASYELESNRSFSIIFHGAQTLDLMTIQNDTFISRDELLKVLDKLIQAFSEAKITVGNDVQLLRYIWLDVDRVSVCFVLFTLSLIHYQDYLILIIY